MHSKIIVAGLLLSGVFASCSGDDKPKEATTAPISKSKTGTVGVPTGTSIFGAPLFVNGKRVSDNDIKRYLIYGPCRLMLELYRVNLIIDDELMRRARDHADSVIESEVVKRAKPVAEAAVAKLEAQKPAELADGDALTADARHNADAVIEPEVAKRAHAAAEAAIAKTEVEKPFASADERQKAVEAEYQKAREVAKAAPDLQALWKPEFEKQRKALAHQKLFDTEYQKQRELAKAAPDLHKIWETEKTTNRKLLDEQLTPTQAEFDAEVKKTIDEFKEKYPFLDTAAEISRAFHSVEWYKINLRQTLLFDRVFYPDDPADWPMTTVEAVRADSGDTLIKDAQESYVVRLKHATDTGQPLPKEDGIYTQMMRQIVRDAMFNTIDFKTAFDGLPDDQVLWGDKDGDGKPELVVTTEQMWEKVKDSVSPTDIEEAKQWFIAYQATHDRLEKEGGLLDAAASKKAIADLAKQFEGTYFNIDLLATQTYYFPSTETYKAYYVLLEGFKKMMEPKLAKQANGDIAAPLREHLAHANQVMGLGQVDVEVMLVSAFDIPHYKWKPDGWNWAKQQADKIKADLDANLAAYNAQRAEAAKAKADGKEYKPANEVQEPFRYWSQMMDEHSEYWDPPSPEGKQHPSSDVGMKRRGRFGPKYRNDLQGFVGETPFRAWAFGESITDYTFFDQAEGTVAGPMHGPLGYYITRVQHRTPPTRPLNLGDPKHVDLLKDDYLRSAFVDYTKEAVAKADISGAKP